MYKSIGFNIDVFHRYNKFNLNSLIDHTRPASLNICEKLLYIPIIKNSIQTTNQVTRCTTNYVPYKRYTNIMIRLLVELIIHSRKSFPQKGNISNRLGSNTIFLGNPSPDFNREICLCPTPWYAQAQQTY